MWQAARRSTLIRMTTQLWKVLGSLALIVVGGGLWLFARDTEFLWFRGGPLGVVLVVVGAIDLVGSLWSRDRRRAE